MCSIKGRCKILLSNYLLHLSDTVVCGHIGGGPKVVMKGEDENSV